MLRPVFLITTAVLWIGCHSHPALTPPKNTAARSQSFPMITLSDFQKKAAQHGTTIACPELETTPEAIRPATSAAIQSANKALDQVGALPAAQLNFNNTIRALDDINYAVGLVANRFGLIKETSPNPALREAATEAVKTLSEWSVGLDYREDVYRTVKAYADSKPALQGEDAKLLEEVLRDYKRAGFALPKADRDQVEQWRKELTGLITDFQSNVTKAKQPVTFSKADLEGVPEDFLNQPGLKTGDDQYTLLANVTFHYLQVLELAKKEATRRRFAEVHDSLARAENIPLLTKILQMRDRIAAKLGYASWADYQIEPKMAKTGGKALEFLERLRTGLEPKFAAELEAFRTIKVRETGDPQAKINVWDWRYFRNLLMKEKYTVDSEQLRVYFPYDKSLQGMFNVYQSIFGLRFERVEPPYKWVEDLQLWAVSDATSGEPLGLFYLDMFPRDGKYNHFAQFGLIEGKLLADGRYQRPTVALICNFPPPSPDKPSLLSHRDVETLFHEFGHALHSILTRAHHSRFSGTSVPRDFVEAPSQMLENWTWDKSVLDSFAADYRDPSKKIPAEIIAKMKEAKLATIASHYRRQLSFGILDLTLHSKVKDGTDVDVVKISNQVLSDVFLPVPPNSAFVAYFGHLMGYDAGYYGYAWADAIAADMATVFQNSPRGFADTAAGKRLRDEIYAPGDSRDVNESIQRFLGRPQSVEPFLKTLGIGAH